MSTKNCCTYEELDEAVNCAHAAPALLLAVAEQAEVTELYGQFCEVAEWAHLARLGEEHQQSLGELAAEFSGEATSSSICTPVVPSDRYGG